MTLPPKKIGDKGQRYVLEAFGYPKEREWNPIAYATESTELIHAQTGISVIPSCEATRIRDRGSH